MSEDAASSAALQAFLQSLHGPFDSYGPSWREDFDLVNLVRLVGAELDQAIAALRAMPADDVRVPRAFAALSTPEAVAALSERLEAPFPDAVRAEAAAQQYSKGVRGRAAAVLAEMIGASTSPSAVTIAVATVRDAPPPEVLPALRARLHDQFESVRQNCAMALVNALPVPRDRRGRRYALLEARLGVELASVRRKALGQLDGLLADAQAGRPLDRWMEADGPESPTFAGFLDVLRDRARPAYDRAALAALAGIERDRAEHMLMAAVLRGDERAPAALAALGDFRAELAEVRATAGAKLAAAIDTVLSG
jgi:hypothetical protein